MVPGIGGGATAAKIAAGAALKRGATRVAAEKAAERAAMVAGGIGESGVTAGQVGGDIEKTIINSPQEQLDKSPRYQELVAQGVDPFAARKKVASEAAVAYGLPAGVVTGLLGAPFEA
jgi:hypothetical protein